MADLRTWIAKRISWKRTHRVNVNGEGFDVLHDMLPGLGSGGATEYADETFLTGVPDIAGDARIEIRLCHDCGSSRFAFCPYATLLPKDWP